MADLDPSWEEALVVEDDAGQHGLDLDDRQSLLIPASTHAEDVIKPEYWSHACLEKYMYGFV